MQGVRIESHKIEAPSNPIDGTLEEEVKEEEEKDEEKDNKEKDDKEE